MTLLAIDTSCTRGSIVVRREGEMLFEESFESNRRHSSHLFDALQRARDSAPQIERIAVGIGPGSYAGIRVSIAAAIGMNIALGAELIGIPSIVTLESAADGYTVIGDARRGSLFIARVKHRQLEGEPELVASEKLASRLHPHEHVYSTEPLPSYPGAAVARPSAAILASLAARNHSIRCLGTLEPMYLREPHITLPRDKPLRP